MNLHVKIETNATNLKPVILFDGVDVSKQINRLKLDMNPMDQNIVEVNFLGHLIEWEGEAFIVANINGRKFKLIEE